jgi:hypothetical protein
VNLPVSIALNADSMSRVSILMPPFLINVVSSSLSCILSLICWNSSLKMQNQGSILHFLFKTPESVTECGPVKKAAVVRVDLCHLRCKHAVR